MPTYVDSNAAGANDGTSWTDAYTSIASTTGVAAGEEIWVASDHSQDNGASLTLNWTNGTFANPVKILSINKTNDTLAAGAQIGTTVGALSLRGHIRASGIIWSSTTNFLINDLAHTQQHDDCTFKMLGNALISFGGSNSGRTTLRNPTLDTSGASGALAMVGFQSLSQTWIRGGSYLTRAAGQFSAFGNTLRGGVMDIHGLSIGNVTNIAEGGGVLIGTLTLRQCNFGTFTNLISAAASNVLGKLLIESCAVGTISVPPLGLTRMENLYGVVASDLTRYRTGGADDGEQANAYSWEMVSDADALEIYSPLESPPMVRWVAAGSQTVTLYVASGVTLQDDEFWVEVSSPDEGGTPTAQGTLQSTRLAPRGTPANLTTDGTSTWNGTGVGTKQKIDVAINPAVAGPVVVRAFLAKASTTVYLDPKISIA